MPRHARIVVAGLPHHVTQRGNRTQPVFFTPDDYQRYLIWLGDRARAQGLKIWAYCLMPNHVHLVVVPQAAAALAKTLQVVHGNHASQINQDHEWTGHLWQGRYFSCVLDEAHLTEAVRYVERNPLRAGLVTSAPDYPWSSAAPHCALRDDPVLSYDLPLLTRVPEWATWLRNRDSEDALARLRACTLGDRPCGDEDFAARVRELGTEG